MKFRLLTVLLPFLSFFLFASDAFARGGGSGRSKGGDVSVRGYTRKDGTYVQPHMRSAPDSTPWNNWSTVGNVNPYTGAVGTKWPSASTGAGGDVYVNGYFRRDGTYVQPHMRSAPDGDPWNNWSTAGNVNPYTGARGTKWPAASTLYAVSGNEAALGHPLSQLRNERLEYPSHFQIGQDGRYYYHYETYGGFWTSEMRGEWPRAEGTTDASVLAIHDRLVQKLEVISWVAAANNAIDEQEYGRVLRTVEAHKADCKPENYAAIQEDVAAIWESRVAAIRERWASGEAREAYMDARNLSIEYAQTSLSERTDTWVRALYDLLVPKAKAG